MKDLKNKLKKSLKTKKYFQQKKYRGDLIFLIGLLAFCSSGFCSYRVPTGSMDPTIKVQDFFLANKLSYRLKIPFTKTSVIDWAKPERGDIIAFKYPLDESTEYTKRVIGLPGDRLKIENQQVYLNGKALELTLISEDEDSLLFQEKLDGQLNTVRFSKQLETVDFLKEITVPENHYFVMGDNRNNSNDSRAWGFVPYENIDGKLTHRWFGFKENSYLPDLKRLGPIK